MILAILEIRGLCGLRDARVGMKMAWRGAKVVVYRQYM
jgi:hypothetical protein